MARRLCPLAAYFLLITLSNIVFQVSGFFWNQAVSKFGAAKSAHVCLGCFQSRSSNRNPASTADCLIVVGL